MKEANSNSPQESQGISRRAFLRKAAGLAAGALLADKFPEKARAQQPETTLSEEELGYIENLEDTVVEPMDPDLSYRPISPIASIELNTENKPDAQAKANLLSFNFSNLVYKNQDLYQQGLEESLYNGRIPGEKPSRKLADEIANNKDYRLKINAMDSSTGELSIVPTQFDPRKGLSIRAVSYPGLLRVNDQNEGFQNHGFTPWIEEGGRLHLDLYVFDREYEGQQERKDLLATIDYNIMLYFATEFMALTGGDQRLWDTYCVPQNTKIGELRQENSFIMFDSIGSIAMGDNNSSGGVLNVTLAEPM